MREDQTGTDSLPESTTSSLFDVGIVGYWYATNYGSVITYYSLFHFIESLGYKTVLIDRPDKHLDGEPLSVFSRVFMEKHARISESYGEGEADKFNSLADIFVIGSDQVWTEHATDLTGYRFFLDFVSDERGKISYAPSFGRDSFNVPSNKKRIISYLLSRFDRISVREEGGINILDRFGVQADVVPDPVFLHDRPLYSSLADLSELDTERKYFLAYILDPTPDKKRILEDAERITGLDKKIILDGRYGTWERNKEALGLENVTEDITPEDWLKLIRDSELVLTDSHHGMAMSLIFGRKVICINNKERGSERFTSLLQRLGISGILIDESDEIDVALHTPWQDDTKERLRSFGEYGRDWLTRALRDANPNKTKKKY